MSRTSSFHISVILFMAGLTILLHSYAFASPSPLSYMLHFWCGIFPVILTLDTFFGRSWRRSAWLAMCFTLATSVWLWIAWVPIPRDEPITTWKMLWSRVIPGSFLRLPYYFYVLISLVIFLHWLFYYISGKGIGDAWKNWSDVSQDKKVRDIVVSFLAFYLSVIFFCGLGYATIHKVVGQYSFKPYQVLSLWDFWYYSVVTITTLGTGDIEPACGIARLLSAVQVLVGVGLVVIYVGVTVSVVVGRGSKKQQP